jgi:serine/threonine-protein kinase
MIACPSCSTPVPDGARFCPRCGAAADPSATIPSGGTGDPDATLASGGAGSTRESGAGRFLPGTVLAGRYRIFGLLGKGGMGEVYRADDLKLGQPVALKFLPPGLDRDPSRLERLLAEVRTARQVTHPNVCRVYDIAEAEGQHFLSMEYVDGEDLASLLRRIGRLPEDKAVQIARQLCAGVHAAHEQGILHRDLKPANVMIDGRGRVRITDFGLARLEDSVEAGEIRSGTPAYMSPEQFRGEDVTVRSDVYALGLVLNELFTGRHAFEGAVDPARRDPTATPVSPSSRLETLNPAVERVILRCLETDPAVRPASALAVAAGLPGGDPLAAALAAGETPSPEMVAEAGSREAMPAGRAVALAALGLVLFVAVARWAGTMSILHFLPLEKKPAVLVDRAQGILDELGFSEPAYQQPVDQGWGLFLWNSVLDQVREADSSSARWEGLRDRPDAMTFWYRQSPRLIVPDPVRSGPIFLRGELSQGNPTPSTAGEVVVSLDLAGRLRRLEVLPKRFSTRDVEEPDWMPLFEMAGLDSARFRETRPRYQRFHVPDRRRAWVGTREDLPDVELHVEAGSFEGRPALFDVSTLAAIEFLGEDPEPEPLTAELLVPRILEPMLMLALVLGAALLARRHLKQGRADRRGATRIAGLLAGGMVAGMGLSSHVVFSPDGFDEVWPLLAAACFLGAIIWVMYVAAEPIGRKVWPTMFVSLSRLLSRPRIELRDPLLGRSALIGLSAGALLFALGGPLRSVFLAAVQGSPADPLSYELPVLLGQRMAVFGLAGAFVAGTYAFLFVGLLVVLRLLFRKSWPAMVLASLLWPLMWGSDSPEEYVVSVVWSVVALVVVLRAGALALLIANVVSTLGQLAAAPDWSAWTGQAAVLAVVCVVALAGYGVWAAMAGRRASASGTATASSSRIA